MCSGGGPVITMETSWFERYSCSSCGKKFKAMGKKPTCPSCQSEDVTKLPD
jgi:rRNA maturation endonuclease Nob1